MDTPKAIPKWQAWLWNLFQYEKIEPGKTPGAVRLHIRHGEETRVCSLPRKHIRLYPRDKEVEIQEWLCIKVGLV